MSSTDSLTAPKDILISIHPQYAEKILDGLKTIELRRRFPILDGIYGRLLIYSTTPMQGVIGFTEIEYVHHLPIKKLWSEFSKEAQIKRTDFFEYFTGKTHGYAAQLKNPKRFSEPLSIDYLKKKYGIIAPQSYRYLSAEYKELFSYEKSKHKTTSRH